MRVKISWDEGATFERECELTDAINPEWDRDEYEAARVELERAGRYWIGGGAAPLGLLMTTKRTET
jgi:hypothetical protein